MARQSNRQSYLESLYSLLTEGSNSTSEKTSFIDNIMRYAPYREISRILVRYELYKKIIDLSGDIFEFGCYFGSGVTTFLQLGELLEPHNYTRRIFGFDTFDGLLTEANDYRGLNQGQYRYSDLNHLTAILNAHGRNKLRPDENYKLI